MNLLKLIRAAVKIPTPHQVHGSTQVKDPPMTRVAQVHPCCHALIAQI